MYVTEQSRPCCSNILYTLCPIHSSLFNCAEVLAYYEPPVQLRYVCDVGVAGCLPEGRLFDDAHKARRFNETRTLVTGRGLFCLFLLYISRYDIHTFVQAVRVDVHVFSIRWLLCFVLPTGGRCVPNAVTLQRNVSAAKLDV